MIITSPDQQHRNSQYERMTERSRSLKISQILRQMPEIKVDSVYCESKLIEDAIKWRDHNKTRILGLK